MYKYDWFLSSEGLVWSLDVAPSHVTDILTFQLKSLHFPANLKPREKTKFSPSLKEQPVSSVWKDLITLPCVSSTGIKILIVLIIVLLIQNIVGNRYLLLRRYSQLKRTLINMNCQYLKREFVFHIIWFSPLKEKSLKEHIPTWRALTPSLLSLN